jgi:hypothetical protein
MLFILSVITLSIIYIIILTILKMRIKSIPFIVFMLPYFWFIALYSILFNFSFETFTLI